MGALRCEGYGGFVGFGIMRVMVALGAWGLDRGMM